MFLLVLISTDQLMNKSAFCGSEVTDRFLAWLGCVCVCLVSADLSFFNFPLLPLNLRTARHCNVKVLCIT